MSKARLRESICRHVVDLLRQERERQAMSMNRLAERSGLSQGMISLVERDLRNPTLDTLLRIAEALQVDLAEVLKAAQGRAKKGA